MHQAKYPTPFRPGRSRKVMQQQTSSTQASVYARADCHRFHGCEWLCSCHHRRCTLLGSTGSIWRFLQSGIFLTVQTSDELLQRQCISSGIKRKSCMKVEPWWQSTIRICLICRRRIVGLMSSAADWWLCCCVKGELDSSRCAALTSWSHKRTSCASTLCEWKVIHRMLIFWCGRWRKADLITEWATSFLRTVREVVRQYLIP